MSRFRPPPSIGRRIDEVERVDLLRHLVARVQGQETEPGPLGRNASVVATGLYSPGRAEGAVSPDVYDGLQSTVLASEAKRTNIIPDDILEDVGIIPEIKGPLSEVSDFRYGAQQMDPLRIRSGSPIRRLIAPQAVSLSKAVHVPNPVSAILCLRRNERKRSILATGSGGGKHKPPKRNPLSDVRC